MKKRIIIIAILMLFALFSSAFASIKTNIIENIKNIENLSFKFEQNINENIETGSCIIEYPKKIYCNYDLKNKKILISDGNMLVIKTITSYYLYKLEETPLNLILDKNFILDRINNSDERIINGKFINYNFEEENIKINLFFDRVTLNLIGWQTLDIYQNLSIMYLNSITKNIKLKKNLFVLPTQN